MVDLFAGAGLFSYAFERVGFRVTRAIELDRHAAATYARNFGDRIEVADVTRVSPAGRADVLIAGPPCQGFSTLGKRDANDRRNMLSLQVAKWARVLQPEVIVIENVEAFLKSAVWVRLARRLKRLGYTVTAEVHDAADYGVPQHRVRSVTFATRHRMMSIERLGRKPTATVRDAWSGLKRHPDGNGLDVFLQPTPLALKRMKVIPSGGDKRDIMRNAPNLAPPSWWRSRSEITDVWGRIEWNLPSNTLRTAFVNPSKGRYIHPEQHRVISLREAARLQTIPDGFEFEGRVPYVVARQIGNSVPPVLGCAIGRRVLRYLDDLP